MGFFGDGTRDSYDNAAAAYKAAEGDMGKLSGDEREKVNRLMSEASGRGNSVRNTRDRHR